MSGPQPTPWRDRLLQRSEWQNDCLVDLTAQQAGEYRYAVVSVGHQTSFRASRLILEERLGRPLARYEIARHTCHNPPCWNENHIIIGSQADNVNDMVEAGRARKRGDTCANGHPWTDVYVGPNGTWTCKICRREADGKRRPPPPEQTHCKRGHPLSGDNLYIAPGSLNMRHCRECIRMRKRERRRRKEES